MIRRPPRSTLDRSSAASDVYKRQVENHGTTTFSLVLPAAKPQQSKMNPSVVLLDDVLIQAAVTSAAEIGAPALRGQDLLVQQMSWEAERMAKRRGWKNLPPPAAQTELDRLTRG